VKYAHFILPILVALLAGPAPAADAPAVNLRRTVTVEVVEKTKGAVVNISTTKLVNQRIGPEADPFWQQFDLGPSAKVTAHSLGSGFIIHPDGYVITNNHVVDRARQITVELADGRKLPADLLSADADADLALLRIHGDKPFPTLQLGDSSDLMIGEPVIAVGNPLGYSHSVSTGIISAVHRDLKDPRQHVLLGNLIQTDAAINPGNSGGPLLNAYGQVIGINTAIRGDAQNIGFAIPIDRLRDLIPELMNPRQITKVEVPLKLSEKRHIEPPATISTQIIATGAQGDTQVIDAINGQHPGNIVDAYALLLRLKAAADVTITPLDGKPQVIKTIPTPLPDAVVQAKKQLGLTIQELSPMLAAKYGLDTEDGLFVTEVARGSIAEKAGVQPGDVIVQLGRYRIGKLQDLASLLPRLPSKGRVRIGVVRGNRVGVGILDFN
jgi:serine protease Do